MGGGGAGLMVKTFRACKKCSILGKGLDFPCEQDLATFHILS